MEPVGIRTKLAFGVGQMAEGIKNRSFETFLFFYYNQVLGLSASLAGLAVFIALIFDAVTDPMAGSLSDNFRSRWGRRHPFMYASALPLAGTFYLLFSPPSGLAGGALFAWLTGFAILVRVSMTLYHVPYLALGAELSRDYDQRTSIVAFRTLFGVLGGFGAVVVGYFYFFRATPEFPAGQLNGSAYPPFAAWFAVAMVISILWSAAGTHSRIPSLPEPPANPERFSFGELFREIQSAFSNASFRALFLGILAIAVSGGIQFSLSLHMFTYFWELSTQQIGILSIVSVAGLVLGVPFWAMVAGRIDKKPTFMISIMLSTVFVAAPPLLKINGYWPSQDDIVLYLGLLGGMGFVVAFGGAAGMVAAGSMMADLADEHELATGRRQEGIFFGALAFSSKCSSGIGHQLAGWGIDLIHFPVQAQPGMVPAEVVRNLGILYGPGISFIAGISLLFLLRYRLSRKSIEEIQQALAQRHGSASSSS